MPVGRMLLKSISDSKKMSQLKTDGARLLYTWLLAHVDVNGCFSADPAVLNGKVFTRLGKSLKTIAIYLEDLENVAAIVRYETNGDVFLIIPDFKDKQPSLNPSREANPTIPLPTPEQLQSNSRQTPTQIKLSKDKLSKDKEMVSRFEHFWAYWPKKVAKQDALRAFQKIAPNEELLQVMLDAVSGAQKTEAWKKDNGKYIPHPATWLNGRRWEDEEIKQSSGDREWDEAKLGWKMLGEYEKERFRSIAKKQYPEWKEQLEKIESMALAIFKRELKEGE